MPLFENDLVEPSITENLNQAHIFVSRAEELVESIMMGLQGAPRLSSAMQGAAGANETGVCSSVQTLVRRVDALLPTLELANVLIAGSGPKKPLVRDAMEDALKHRLWGGAQVLPNGL